MRSSLVVVGLSVALLTGCGDSPQHKLATAALAIRNGVPQKAVEQASSVLASDPSNLDAKLILAQANIQLALFPEARALIDELLKDPKVLAAPDRVYQTHVLAVSWANEKMRTVLRQSDFATNASLQQQFEEALSQANQEADYFAAQPKQLAEAEFRRGQFAVLDANRLNLLVEHHRKALTAQKQENDPTASDSPMVRQYESQSRARFKDAAGHFTAAIESDPARYDAATQLVALLIRDSQWPEIWTLANRMAAQQKLPPKLAQELTTAVLLMPDSIQPANLRKDVGWKLVQQVEEGRRKDAAWLITAARLHLIAEEPAKAKPILEQLLTQSPTDKDGRLLLGHTLFKLDKFQEAKAVLEKLATEPEGRENPNVLSVYGRTLVRTGDSTTARDMLRRAVERNPDDTQARQALIALLSEFKEAGAQDIQEMYSRTPADPRAIQMKLLFEQHNNRREVVAEVLSSVEKLDPLLPEHLSILITGNIWLKQYEKAEKFARELVKKKPEVVETHLALAEILSLQGRDEQARTLLEGLKEKFADKGGVDQLMARLYLQRQNYDKAAELLTAVLERQPGNIEARLMLATAYAGVSNTAEAIEQIERVLESSPHNVAAHSLAARIYRFTGQNDLSDRHLSQINESDVNEQTQPALLVQIKLKQDKPDEAAEICNRALSMGNRDPALRVLLAQIYLGKGEFAQAEASLQGLISDQPANLQNYMMLVDFYIRQKQVDKGITELRRLQYLNELNARLAQANLLSRANQVPEAIESLSAVYKPLVQNRDGRALLVADTLSKLYLLQKEPQKAMDTLQQLIDGGVGSQAAALAKVDIILAAEGPAKAVAALDEIAQKLGPQDRRLRENVLRRYVVLRRPDQALNRVDRWLALTPADAELQRWKSQLLVGVGKPAEAVAMLQKLLEKDRSDVSTWMRLVEAQLASTDYPGAEASLRGMAAIDSGVKLQALSSLGQMYVQLGLYPQATAAFQELEAAGRPKDPRLLFAMGFAHWSMKQDEQATPRLAAIPPYAPNYAQAQILLARIDDRQGKPEDARKRLEELVRNPRHAAGAASELLSFDLKHRREADLLAWADKALTIEALPADQRARWLQVRVTADANRRNWQGVSDTLRRLMEINPKATSLQAAQIAVLLRQSKREEARQLYLASEDLIKTDAGRMLALALRETPHASAPRTAWSDYLDAIARGDLDAARSAVSQLPSDRAMHRGDLLLALQGSDVQTADFATAIRALAGATVALRAGLPSLAEDLAEQVATRFPGMIPAYALQATAMLEQKKSTTGLLQRLSATSGDTSLAKFLAIREKEEANDVAGALTLCQSLMEKEPENDHVRYALAQLQLRAGKPLDAIATLDQLWNKPGPLQGPAGNDLAFLISEHQPARLDEAYTIASRVLQVTPASAAMQDTLGWIEHQRGNHQVALRYLGLAITGLKDSGEAHYHIGAAYKAAGNETWARLHLERAAADPADQAHVAKAKALLGK